MCMREHSRSSELESEMSQKRERWLWTWSRHKLKRAIVQLAACSADERLSFVTVTQTDVGQVLLSSYLPCRGVLGDMRYFMMQIVLFGAPVRGGMHFDIDYLVLHRHAEL